MKLSLLQKYLRSQRIDLLILVNPDPNIVYFTRCEPSHAYLVITSANAFFFITKLDNPPPVSGIVQKDLIKDWHQMFLSKKHAVIGINKEAMTLAQVEGLKKLFPKTKFLDISTELQKLRREKTPEELSCIQQACAVTSRAFAALVQELSRSTLHTEQDVAFFLERYIKKKGRSLAFPTIAAMGKNAAVPHHITDTTRLTRGFLLVDFGARYKNYCADMTRCIFLGIPTPSEKEYYRLLLQAQEAAIAAVQEAISYKELDAVARTVLGSEAKNFVHSLGHGIGIEVHEKPVFSQEGEGVVKNVPFTIEPGLYIKGKVGLRIEDTLVWDGRKVKILTTAPKKLLTVASWK